MSEHDRAAEPVDFSALGPGVSRARLDGMLTGTMRSGAAELERRRGAVGVVRVVIAWRRPVLMMSGLAAAAAIALTVGTRPQAVTRSMAGAESAGSIADALGIPPGYAAAVEGYSNRGAMP